MHVTITKPPANRFGGPGFSGVSVIIIAGALVILTSVAVCTLLARLAITQVLKVAGIDRRDARYGSAPLVE